MRSGEYCDGVNIGHVLFVIFVGAMLLGCMGACITLACQHNRRNQKGARNYRRIPLQRNGYSIPPTQQMPQQWYAPNIPLMNRFSEQTPPPFECALSSSMLPERNYQQNYGTMGRASLYPDPRSLAQDEVETKEEANNAHSS